MLRALRRAVREGALVARRAARGSWRWYGNPSAANTGGEALLALRALTGGMPLEDGAAIAEYERRFAETVGTARAFSFAAGRMAFFALLEALDVGPGDEVIVPAFTCVVVPNAILYRGATPVYVDIDERTFNIDVSRIEQAITSRTKVIVAQHTFGLPCDVAAISDIAGRNGIVVVEDGAHALGASVAGRPVGSLATAAFFSTDHTKVIGTGTGGIVTTSDEDLIARLEEIQRRAPFLPVRRLRRALAAFAAEVVLLHPLLAPVGRVLLEWWLRPGAETPFFLDELQTAKPDAYPFPARLGAAQARIGLSQLGRLRANVAHRRRLADAYDAVLGAYDGLDVAEHVFVRYAFLADDRGQWQRRLEDVVDMGVWFTSVVHGRDVDLEAVRYAAGSCPVAEHAAAHVVNLPTHPRLGDPAPVLARLERP